MEKYIKLLAIGTGILGSIGSLLYGVTLLYIQSTYKEITGTAVFIMISGPFCSFVCAMVLYAFGEMLAVVKQIRALLCRGEE